MRFFLTVLILILGSCSQQPEWTVNSFFEQAFNIIEESSVKRNEIDWAVLKQNVKDSIGQFETNEDVYRAISYTVELIDDGHSQFADAHTPTKLTADTLSIPDVTSKVIGKRVGYLRIPGFMGNDSLSSMYTLEIRKALKEFDNTRDLSGWIIDLRGNGGGKASVVPLGVSPLFKDSLIGIFCDKQGIFREISCSSDYFYLGEHKMDSLHDDSTLNNEGKKIAVLVDGETASAAEFLMLGFKFQDKTRVFGSETRGLTSHLMLIDFKSDAKLLLACSYYYDKDKNVIDGPIAPDENCPAEKCLDQAVAWVENAI